MASNVLQSVNVPSTPTAHYSNYKYIKIKNGQKITPLVIFQSEDHFQVAFKFKRNVDLSQLINTCSSVQDVNKIQALPHPLNKAEYIMKQDERVLIAVIKNTKISHKAFFSKENKKLMRQKVILIDTNNATTKFESLNAVIQQGCISEISDAATITVETPTDQYGPSYSTSPYSYESCDQSEMHEVLQ